jgi:outer membrane receptor protein involved in Fe transport
VFADETVVVSDDAPRVDAEATPASVTVIPIDEHLARGADLASVLDATTGAHVSSFGGLGDYSAVSLRGSTWRQVEVFLDGVPLNPDGGTTVNLAEIPLWAFDRVEVYRSGAPPELLAAPIGGVVNLVTREDPGPPTLGAAGGDHRTARLDQTAGGSVGPIDVLAFSELFTTAGDFRYWNDGGTLYDTTDDRFADRANNDKTELFFHTRLEAHPAGLRLRLVDSFVARDSGLPGNALYVAKAARLDTVRNLEALDATGGRAPWRYTLRAWGVHRRETLSDPLEEVTLDGGGHSIETTSAGVVAHVAWAPSAHVVPALTASARKDHVVASDDSHERTVLTGAGSFDLRFAHDAILVSPVVQATALEAEATGALLSVDPRVGALFRPSRALALKANVGRYFRPPDLLELYGEQGTTVGNPDLVPERGITADIGARWQLPARTLTGTIEATLFWNEVQDLVVFVENAQRVGFPVNLGAARIRGAEVALDVHLGSILDSTTAVTATSSENRETAAAVAGNQIPRVPRWDVDQTTQIHLGDAVVVGHAWSFVDGNTWDAPNFYWAAPRSIHDAFVRVHPSGGWPELELDVLNLFDHVTETIDPNPLDAVPDRATVALTDFQGYPLAGRTWLVHLRFGV